MDSNYNSEAVIPAASNSDRKQRRMAASTNEMVKIASKDVGISLKESVQISADLTNHFVINWPFISENLADCFARTGGLT